MKKEIKGSMIIYILIVLLVVALMIFLSIRKTEAPTNIDTKVGTEGNLNEVIMDNTQQTQNEEVKKDESAQSDLKTESLEGGAIKVTILKEGDGDVAKSGDTVAMGYTGKLLNGTTFDSNVDPKFGHPQPFTFTLGEGRVIKGWDIGVAGMKIGEKRKLEIKSEYAYGNYSPSALIPANSDMVFEVELLAIKK